jgi:tRNA threonylcarbamoyl adenosine modification protein (Sua5/YciO/YrdC/YwlC family)
VTYEVDPANPDPAALRAAATALASAQLVVLPTETVYGIAARPDLPTATDQLFEAKRRPPSLNLPVLVSSAPQAWDVAEPTPGARALAAAFWPGPLTLVLPRTAHSNPWMLGERRDTIAVRVPDHRIPLAVVGMAGPLATTSANISGQAPASTRDELEAAFADRAEVILVLREGAPAPGGVASTLVDCSTDEVRILRRGGITETEIHRELGDSSRGR